MKDIENMDFAESVAFGKDLATAVVSGDWEFDRDGQGFSRRYPEIRVKFAPQGVKGREEIYRSILVEHTSEGRGFAYHISSHYKDLFDKGYEVRVVELEPENMGFGVESS